MDRLAFDILLFVAAFTGMEAFAWFTHKYVMHGFLWVWHRSHHTPRTGMFELNDLFAVVFAAAHPSRLTQDDLTCRTLPRSENPS